MKLLVVNNLSSGLQDGSIYDFIRTLAADGDEICLRSSDGTTPLEALVADAYHYDAVVASGGDGTIASICYALRGSGIPILPFPSGTANLLALNLASPEEPHALKKVFESGRILDFDLGEIEIGGRRDGFTIVAGAGYDATIMHEARSSKRLLGPLAYFSAAVTNPMPQVSKFSIRIDGNVIHSEGIGILVANFSKIQFDITLAHDNRPRDGKLDVVVLKTESAIELIPTLFASMLDHSNNNQIRQDTLESYQGREIEVFADPALEVQYDGETPELTTPFSARVLPAAARLFVSEEGYGLFSEASPQN